MKIKVGDNVKILAGKDKGKTGKVIKTLRKDDRVVVEGINMIKKHIKPNQSNDQGGIIDMEASIHVSNVKKIDEAKTTKKVEKKTTKTEKKDK